jgi:hypothetical protein
MTQNNKVIAGWVALSLASVLAITATVARWFPTSTSSNEAIITSLLAFAAAAFGILTYESTRKSRHGWS